MAMRPASASVISSAYQGVLIRLAEVRNPTSSGVNTLWSTTSYANRRGALPPVTVRVTGTLRGAAQKGRMTERIHLVAIDVGHGPRGGEGDVSGDQLRGDRIAGTQRVQ